MATDLLLAVVISLPRYDAAPNDRRQSDSAGLQTDALTGREICVIECAASL